MWALLSRGFYVQGKKASYAKNDKNTDTRPFHYHHFLMQYSWTHKRKTFLSIQSQWGPKQPWPLIDFHHADKTTRKPCFSTISTFCTLKKESKQTTLLIGKLHTYLRWQRSCWWDKVVHISKGRIFLEWEDCFDINIYSVLTGSGNEHLFRGTGSCLVKMIY